MLAVSFIYRYSVSFQIELRTVFSLQNKKMLKK